jgi:hypothetical protein
VVTPPNQNLINRWVTVRARWVTLRSGCAVLQRCLSIGGEVESGEARKKSASRCDRLGLRGCHWIDPSRKPCHARNGLARPGKPTRLDCCADTRRLSFGAGREEVDWLSATVKAAEARASDVEQRAAEQAIDAAAKAASRQAASLPPASVSSSASTSNSASARAGQQGPIPQSSWNALNHPRAT